MDILNGFKKKTLTWDQITFNKATVAFLEQNLEALLNK